MNANRPRYLLLVESVLSDAQEPAWRFVLCHQSSGRVWTATDQEPGCDASRTAVLALVRGLEALPEPASVTVVTADRNVRNGLGRGLTAWSANSWKWERFGRLVTVRDDDLWRRVEQALQIHEVACRSWRLSVTDHSQPPTEALADERRTVENADRAASVPVADSLPAFSFEPALLVVRKPRRTLRFADSQSPDTRAPMLARA